MFFLREKNNSKYSNNYQQTNPSQNNNFPKNLIFQNSKNEENLRTNLDIPVNGVKRYKPRVRN